MEYRNCEVGMVGCVGNMASSVKCVGCFGEGDKIAIFFLKESCEYCNLAILPPPPKRILQSCNLAILQDWGGKIARLQDA